MASYYVWSGASAGGNGTTWVLAYQTLTLALASKAAGDIFYIAHDHAESAAAALTLGTPGTLSAPCQFLCVNRAGSVPPVSADLRTTATVTTTGAFGILLAGTCYWYGVIFQVGTGATATNLSVNATSGAMTTLVNCKIRILTTAAASTVAFQSLNGFTLWINVVVELSATGQSLSPIGFVVWRNTPSAIAGATIPSNLINSTADFNMTIEAVDFSAMGAGKNIAFSNGPDGAYLVLKDCKLGAGTASTAPSGPGALRIDVINCDSGDTNTRFERYRYEAVETTEATIVRTGGASDGTTTVSRKIVTTSNARWMRPYEAMPLSIWNETTGSAITLTVECISSAVLNNDDIWLDIEYLGTSGFPLGINATTGKADILATGVANTTSSATWGGALTGKFKLAATITPQEKGWIYVYPKVGKASTTVYVDPKITVT